MQVKFLLILLLHTAFIYGQSKKEILTAIKEKKLEVVLSHVELPFDLLAGSEIDQLGITDRTALKQKFKLLFELDYFKRYFLSKCEETAGNRIILIYRVLNRNGELESESSMSFEFSKNKKGRYFLRKIELAG